MAALNLHHIPISSSALSPGSVLFKQLQFNKKRENMAYFSVNDRFGTATLCREKKTKNLHIQKFFMATLELTQLMVWVSK